MGTALDQAVLQRRDIYRGEFGLPAEIDPDTPVITLTGGAKSGVRAIILPPKLGRYLWPALSSMDFAIPVISGDRPDSKGRHWKLLARSGDGDESWYRLYGRKIERDRIGLRFWPPSRIALPTPGDPRRVWLELPRPDLMSSYRELGEALGRLLSQPGEEHAPWL